MGKAKRESPAKDGFFGQIWDRFGEVAVRLGLVSNSNIEKALAKQATDQPRKRIGKILVDAGKITMDQVKEVLKVQKEWFRKAQAKKPTAKAGKKAAIKTKPAKKKPVKATAKKPTAKAGKKTVAKAKPAKKKSAKATAKKATAKAGKKTATKAKLSKKKSPKPKNK